MQAIVSSDNKILLLEPRAGLVEILKAKGHKVRLADVEYKWIIREVGDGIEVGDEEYEEWER